MLIRRIALAISCLFVAVLAIPIASADGSSVISLQPGGNAVTWSGAEPYAISNFDGTRITQIHRFDPYRRQYLSHFVGQTDGTLPESHLLPRVQYLLIANAATEIRVPAPLPEVDAAAPLRFADPPDAPLRIERYWPNEDSPLEDLVVLRGADQFLSVRAHVSGGIGETSIWWMIDGSPNHQGAASDHVDLTPGGHDHGLLYAADEAGQVVVVELPRIVRLPELQLPEVTYGVTAHVGVPDHPGYRSQVELEAAAEAIAAAGFSTVMVAINLYEPLDPHDDSIWTRPETFRERLAPFTSRGLSVLLNVGNLPVNLRHTTSYDPAHPDAYRIPGGNPTIDPYEAQRAARYVARSLPDITYFSVPAEPNNKDGNASLDPYATAAIVKASALGLWYENPNAIVLGTDFGCSRANSPGPIDEFGWSEDTACKEAVVADAYLEAMYDAGFGPYFDIVSIGHFALAWNVLIAMDQLRAVMNRHGDADKPIWIVEIGWSTNGYFPLGSDGKTVGIGKAPPEVQANLIVGVLEALEEHPDVSGRIVYNFQDVPGISDWEDNTGIVFHGLQDGEFVPKPAYWAIREFLTGQPPPGD